MIVEEDSRYADDSLDEVAFSRIAIALAFLPLVVFPTLGLLVVQPFATLFLDNQTPVFSLLLAYPIVMVQIPFVAIASFQSMRFLENPTRVYETVWVRWGISIGVLVGAYFSTLTLGILFFVLSTEPWTLLILVFQLLLTILILWDGFGFFPDYSLNKWLFPVFLTLLVLISSIIEVGGPIVRPVFLLLVFAAPGFLMVEVGLSVYAWRIWWSCDIQSAPAKAPRYFPLGLLTLFTTTLIYSIKLAFVWRANLPPPQNCFIATAAAQGHPAIVGSWEITDEDGRIHRVNRQLLTLKEFERRLMKSAPGSHAGLRAVYNRVGPVVAWVIRHKVLADVAYIALKPVEWGARLMTTKRTGIEGQFQVGKK